jgi:hypothetical protein
MLPTRCRASLSNHQTLLYSYQRPGRPCSLEDPTIGSPAGQDTPWRARSSRGPLANSRTPILVHGLCRRPKPRERVSSARASRFLPLSTARTDAAVNIVPKLPYLDPSMAEPLFEEASFTMKQVGGFGRKVNLDGTVAGIKPVIKRRSERDLQPSSRSGTSNPHPPRCEHRGA